MTGATQVPLSREQGSLRSGPVECLGKYINFTSNSEEAWFNKTAPILERLLSSSGYSIDHQYQYLTFYYRVLVPALGPYPQTYSSTITGTGLPVEFSVNYQEHGDKTVVRIGFEPVTSLSGTARDPYNQRAPSSLLNRVANIDPKNFDDRLWHYFAHEHTVTPIERARLNGEAIQGSELRTSMTFGFDLKDGDVVVKGYSSPAKKVQATKKTLGDLMANSIRNLRSEMDCEEAFNTVHSYMEEINGYNKFAFFSWDCVVPPLSRLKFYGLDNNITWAKAEEIWTLNGRVKTSTTVKALQRLRQLWDLLGIQEGDTGYSGTFDRGEESGQATRAPMIWNYEMRPDSHVPQPKLYLPAYGENDLKIVTALSRFFDILGLSNLAKTYPDTVRSLFPQHDLSKTRRLLAWVSYAYSEDTGVYLSVYYHSSSDYPWAD
ncbi:aromatic prenyltransferase [Aspergillus floccosus]